MQKYSKLKINCSKIMEMKNRIKGMYINKKKEFQKR
jgi:hypothetical protein